MIVVVFCGNPKDRNGYCAAIVKSSSQLDCRNRLENCVVGTCEESRLLTTNDGYSAGFELLQRRRVSTPVLLLCLQDRTQSFTVRSVEDRTLTRKRYDGF